MVGEQLIVLGVLATTLVLFVWNRWRYDVVALGALLVVAVAGIVPPEQVFEGLGHPAVVTVAAVLVVSRGLQNAGVVDVLARQLTRIGDRPALQVATLTAIVALCSGFMNNVGALALLMPVAVWMSRRSDRSPSLLLMPLAFGSLLGGTLTLIGTPPNIIISAYRAEAAGQPFGMFDFTAVGLGLSLVGVLFISLVGWRLTPKRVADDPGRGLFEIGDYLAELRVPEACSFVGKTLRDLVVATREEAEIVVVGLIRDGERQTRPSSYLVLQAADLLLVEADPENLKTLLDLTGLELPDPEKGEPKAGHAKAGELGLVEAIVTADSLLVGTTVIDRDLRARYGVNLVAVARQGARLRERLGTIRFVAGDILLLQANPKTLAATLNTLGCLPLASRGLRIDQPRKLLLGTALYGSALALIALDFVSPATALVACVLAMLLAGLVSRDELYKSIDMPVVILLAAMLPIGHALDRTGGSERIASALLQLAAFVSPTAAIALLMASVMLLTNVINNAAAAILAAPIAVRLAAGMECSPDPFLMAVAIGSSCAFLTPIGHQSNVLVMTPGGYRFGDYWRMGLPLSLIVVSAGVPLIVYFWPL